jgi:hypothetical protein
LAAVELLKAMNRDGTRVLPNRPPVSFLPTKWRKLIFENGSATGTSTRLPSLPHCVIA